MILIKERLLIMKFKYYINVIFYHIFNVLTANLPDNNIYLKIVHFFVQIGNYYFSKVDSLILP